MATHNISDHARADATLLAYFSLKLSAILKTPAGRAKRRAIVRISCKRCSHVAQVPLPPIDARLRCSACGDGPLDSAAQVVHHGGWRYRKGGQRQRQTKQLSLFDLSA